MKWALIALWFSVMMFQASVAFGCSKDWIDGPSGPCTAYDPKPSDPVKVDSSGWISDDAPPKTTTGEWQTGKFKVWTTPPTLEENLKVACDADRAAGRPLDKNCPKG